MNQLRVVSRRVDCYTTLTGYVCKDDGMWQRAHYVNKCVSKMHIRQMHKTMCNTVDPLFNGNICVADCMPLSSLL